MSRRNFNIFIDDSYGYLNGTFSLLDVLELLWGRYWNRNKRNQLLFEYQCRWANISKKYRNWTDSVVRLKDGSYVRSASKEISLHQFTPDVVKEYEHIKNFNRAKGWDNFILAVFEQLPKTIQHFAVQKFMYIGQSEEAVLFGKIRKIDEIMDIRLKDLEKLLYDDKILAEAAEFEKIEKEVYRKESELIQMLKNVVVDLNMLSERNEIEESTVIEAIAIEIGLIGAKSMVEEAAVRNIEIELIDCGLRKEKQMKLKILNKIMVCRFKALASITYLDVLLKHRKVGKSLLNTMEHPELLFVFKNSRPPDHYLLYVGSDGDIG